MSDKHREQRGRILSYFSHSYRTLDRHLNLHFWELFSERGLYFSVDPPVKSGDDAQQPMSVSYLEWLMSRCACFVAVVPRRTDDPDSPFPCSKYQVFEAELAMRANKPMLILAEAEIPRDLFPCTDDEISFFHRDRYVEQTRTFRGKVRALARRAAPYATDIASPQKPVGVLLDQGREPYSETLVSAIGGVLEDAKLLFGGVCRPTSNRSFAPFMRLVRGYEFVISEVRAPYVPVDVVGALHDRGIPCIWICHLAEQETEADAARSMRLSHSGAQTFSDWTGDWPTVLRGTRIDEQMQPVIFWRTADDLVAGLRARVNRSMTQRKDLATFSDAQLYFLTHGEPAPRVFISSAGSQNTFAHELSLRLNHLGIIAFQYKKEDAIPEGTRDWWSKIEDEIDQCEVFVSLIDEKYEGSPYCVGEFERAWTRAEGKNGEAFGIYSYLLSQMDWPAVVRRLQGRDLWKDPREAWVDIVANRVVRHLRSTGVSPES